MEAIPFKEQIWDSLRKTTDKMEEVFYPVLSHSGLTIIQLRILSEIWKNDLCTIGSIGKKTRIQSGNISSICKKLEKEGFIKRYRDPQDERIVRPKLTALGKKVVTEVDKDLQDIFLPILEKEEPEDLEAIFKGLEHLYRLFEKMSSIQAI